MSTLAPRRPRVKPARTVRLAVPPSPAHPEAILTITQAGAADYYAARAIPCDWGNAFQVTKLGQNDTTAYAVHLDRQGQSCECKGFLRWGHCRHIEALMTLCEAGKLPVHALWCQWPEGYAEWSDAVGEAAPLPLPAPGEDDGEPCGSWCDEDSPCPCCDRTVELADPPF